MKIQGPLDQGPARAGVGSKVGDFSDGLSDIFIKWLIKSDFDFFSWKLFKKSKKRKKLKDWQRSWKVIESEKRKNQMRQQFLEK